MRLGEAQARWLRCQAQLLGTQPPTASVADVVRKTAGLQAQDTSAAALGVRVRLPDSTRRDVDRTLEQDRSIVRTWAMRGTLHWLAAEDLEWLLPLLGPVFQRASQRRRLQLGLDDETVHRGVRLLRSALADAGPQTRAELVSKLAHRGLQLAGQARPHLLAYAALDGLLCFGPERDGEPTYVLIEDWLPRIRRCSREQGLEELGKRYLLAYGPARSEDLATWSGLPSVDVRAAWDRIGADIVDVEVQGKQAWMPRAHAGWLDALAERPGDDAVRLLPAFDSYLLGHKRRDLAVAAAYAKRVNAGGGMVRPTVLLDGRVIGTWRVSGTRLEVTPFEPIGATTQSALEREAQDVARFNQTKKLELQVHG